jgi:hypothetical protein
MPAVDACQGDAHKAGDNSIPLRTFVTFVVYAFFRALTTKVAGAQRKQKAVDAEAGQPFLGKFKRPAQKTVFSATEPRNHRATQCGASWPSEQSRFTFWM